MMLSMTETKMFDHIFDERGMLLAFFGALGGAVRSAALKTTWREGLRVMFIGSATAFGVGALAPFLLKPWIGDIPQDMHGALGTISASAFLVGLLAVTLMERWFDGNSKDNTTRKDEPEC